MVCRNFSDFEKVEVFILIELFEKVRIYASTLRTKDFHRKEIHSHLRATFLRVQNASTRVVTTFEDGLDSHDLEIATDAIWTTTFLERRKGAELLAHQKNLLQKTSVIRFNLSTLSLLVESINKEYNPLKHLFNHMDHMQSNFREEELSKYIPYYENLGAFTVYGGRENVLSSGCDSLFSLNSDYIPPWLKNLLQPIKEKGEDFIQEFNRVLPVSMQETLRDNPYFSMLYRDLSSVDSLDFYTEEEVVLHSNVMSMGEERDLLLKKLNDITDPITPIMDTILVAKKHYQAVEELCHRHSSSPS